MSASREKKPRQGESGDVLSERAQQLRKEQETARRNRITYTIIGVVAVILIAALLVWDSGIFQRKATAVTIDGTDHTVAEVQYFYSNAIQTEYQYAMYGLSAFDASKNPKDQIKDEATGETWHDHFIEQAVESMKYYVALENDANANGFTLPDEAVAYKESILTSIDNAVTTGGYGSRQAYLKLNFGDYMTEAEFEKLLDREITVMYYTQAKQDDLTYTQDELDAYYREHADDLDTFIYDQLAFRASVPAETNEDGSPIEHTEEEEAALLETAKADTKALAETVKARLDAGESMEALAEEYADKLYSTQLDETRFGSSVNTSLADWIFADDCTAGSTTLAEHDGNSYYIYYVAQMKDRYRDDSATANVRHILVSAGSDPTDDDYVTAKNSASELLEQWQSGDATEEHFAQLASLTSADTSSASNGGLISNINATNSYVDTFMDWCLDSSRTPGDVDIIQTTGSSTKGWHIMYFSSWGDPMWKITTQSALSTDDMNDWIASLTEGITAELGDGIKHVSI